MDFINDSFDYNVELTDEDIWNFGEKMLAKTTTEINRYPYPYLNALREHEDGIHKVGARHPDGDDFYIVTRYEDVNELLRSTVIEKQKRVDEETRMKLVETNPIASWAQNSILFISGNEHKNLRGLVNKSFTPKIVSQLLPIIKTLSEYLGDKMITNNKFDFVSEFGFQLPVQVIMSMLGIPESERKKVREWTEFIVKSATTIPDKSQLSLIFAAIKESKEYFNDLCEERRKRPQEDLISNLVAAEINGQKLNDEELYSTIITIMVAGHETTTNVIGLSLLHILRDHDLYHRLLSSPENITNSVDEFLRFEPTITYSLRWAHEDTEYKGHSFKKGQGVMLIYGAANRDPKVFDQPDTLMLNRANVKHLSFSGGAHYCLGAPLARAELDIALRTVLPKLLDYEPLGEEIDTKKLGTIRGLSIFPFERR